MYSRLDRRVVKYVLYLSCGWNDTFVSIRLRGKTSGTCVRHRISHRQSSVIVRCRRRETEGREGGREEVGTEGAGVCTASSCEACGSSVVGFRVHVQLVIVIHETNGVVNSVQCHERSYNRPRRAVALARQAGAKP